MTLDEIREWYEANKIHTLYQGHWCRTCSVGALLDAVDKYRSTLRVVRELLERNGCDCECGHRMDEHVTSCDVCLACRIAAECVRRLGGDE